MKATKRHPGLQPFSRDHGIGLVCAQRLRKAVRGTGSDRIILGEQVRSVCFEIIGASLEDERQILTPLIGDTALTQAFYEHHKEIGDLIAELRKVDPTSDPGLGLVSRLADALDRYVRWEENRLFPVIEDKLTAEELKRLAEVAAALESHRHRPTQELHASRALDKFSGRADTCGCSLAREKEPVAEEQSRQPRADYDWRGDACSD